MTVADVAWPARLARDPIGPLLASEDRALAWSVRHDLLGEAGSPADLWELPAALRLLRRQRADGSWAHPGGHSRIRSAEDYDQLGTYQALLPLVAKYRLDRAHPALTRAADFLLGFHAPAGDLRGIYGSQYSPNYTAAILELLSAAGLADDPRVVRGLDWLLAMRQADGGWAIPFRTTGGSVARSFSRAMALPDPLEPDRLKPFSHFVTGIVVRALAAHPAYRRRPETIGAAQLLAGRFFLADSYPDRADASFWAKLSFPFRWTDLLSSLDAISVIGSPASNGPDVASAVRWLIDAQGDDGLWSSGYALAADRDLGRWVSFAAARALRRFGLRTDQGQVSWPGL
jgi:hypothetical protein